MDLDLTEDQKMLRTMVRDLLEKECPKSLVREMEEDKEGGHPTRLWSQMAELGLLGLPFPEKYGGGGGSFLDLAIMIEEAGRACMPGALFSTIVLGGLPILISGSEELKQKYLPMVSEGKIFTLALVEDDGSYEPDCIEATAVAEGDGYVISGTKMFVPNAHIADYMLCLARTSKGTGGAGLTLFVIDGKSQGITNTLLDTISGDKQCETVFEKVKVSKDDIVGEVDKGWQVMEEALRMASSALCADLLGAAEAALEMSIAYACERVAFEHPIGSFQAIQHHLANAKVQTDGIRFMTYQAAWRISEGLPAVKEAAMAKAWVNEAFRLVGRIGQQIHGSIGYTSDHDMQLYFRRGKATEALFGDTEYHREIVACELGL